MHAVMQHWRGHAGPGVVRCGVGGIKALVQDPEQLRRAVEFGTACGAYVTQVATGDRCARTVRMPV